MIVYYETKPSGNRVKLLHHKTLDIICFSQESFSKKYSIYRANKRDVTGKTLSLQNWIRQWPSCLPKNIYGGGLDLFIIDTWCRKHFAIWSSVYCLLSINFNHKVIKSCFQISILKRLFFFEFVIRRKLHIVSAIIFLLCNENLNNCCTRLRKL